MAAFTEAKFDAVVPVKMKALITAIAVYTLLDTYGLHRAAGDTLKALLTDLVQAQFFFRNQRMIANIGIGHQTSHATGTAGGRDKLGVDAETSQITQIAQMLVRPAGRHCIILLIGILILSCRRQRTFVTVFPEPGPHVFTEFINQMVGNLVGNTPIWAGKFARVILYYQFLLEWYKKNHHRFGRWQEILWHPVVLCSHFRQHSKAIINGTGRQQGRTPPIFFIKFFRVIAHVLRNLLSQRVNVYLQVDTHLR